MMMAALQKSTFAYCVVWCGQLWECVCVCICVCVVGAVWCGCVGCCRVGGALALCVVCGVVVCVWGVCGVCCVVWGAAHTTQHNTRRLKSPVISAFDLI